MNKNVCDETMCVLCGRKTMLAMIMLLVLSINGGLYVGTILHSASEMSRFDQALDIYQKLWG